MIKTFNLYGLFTPCCRGSKIIPVREDKDISEFFHKCKVFAKLRKQHNCPGL
uniref:Uncharacterized protein n=1 Tax=Myoviridae sp. ctcFb5 TaxID=2825137 RepID=A0A8S5PVT9_9CAUD|nr:MAG TPA: hypothetical protein [Myoviridae sp. ctcFb5]DAF02681.1 MAG TPA: hypothetical protein [Caudoviricetes sp.]DAT98813.1 MAG TPA: hypothetical protein [Caudoviricetes sp.]